MQGGKQRDKIAGRKREIMRNQTGIPIGMKLGKKEESFLFKAEDG